MLCDFVDSNEGSVAALSAAFGDVPGITVTRGRIGSRALPATGPRVALVAAGNSFAHMSGGQDKAVSDACSGIHGRVDADVRRVIAEKWFGELPVGACEIVAAHRGNPSGVGWLAYAPTTRVPEPLGASTLNPYLAFRGVLAAAMRHPSVDRIVCCSFCTGSCEVDPRESARQMRAAWDSVATFSGATETDLCRLFENHRRLTARA